MDTIASKNLIDHGDPSGCILRDVCNHILELPDKFTIIKRDFMSLAVTINELVKYWMGQLQRNSLLGKTRMTVRGKAANVSGKLWDVRLESDPMDATCPWDP